MLLNGSLMQCIHRCICTAGISRAQQGIDAADLPHVHADARQRHAHNAVFLAVVSATVAASSVLGFSALTSTALTYGAVWAGIKFVELVLPFGFIFAMFATSVTMWYGSLFLMNNPEWLESLLRV
jgi:hypothetical protein